MAATKSGLPRMPLNWFLKNRHQRSIAVVFFRVVEVKYKPSKQN